MKEFPEQDKRTEVRHGQIAESHAVNWFELKFLWERNGQATHVMSSRGWTIPQTGCAQILQTLQVT